MLCNNNTTQITDISSLQFIHLLHNLMHIINMHITLSHSRQVWFIPIADQRGVCR